MATMAMMITPGCRVVVSATRSMTFSTTPPLDCFITKRLLRARNASTDSRRNKAVRKQTITPIRHIRPKS